RQEDVVHLPDGGGDAGDVGGDAEERGVAERDQTAHPHQCPQAGGEQPPHQAAGEQGELERVGDQRDEGQAGQRHQRGYCGPAAGHGSALPAIPCGRIASTTTTRAIMVKPANAGNSALPSASTRPTSRLAANAPWRLPGPPSTTITSASTSTSNSWPIAAPRMGAPSPAASPASRPERAKTPMNTGPGRTPVASSICGSSTPARTSAPNRVRSCSHHNPRASSRTTPIRNSR